MANLAAEPKRRRLFVCDRTPPHPGHDRPPGGRAGSFYLFLSHVPAQSRLPAGYPRGAAEGSGSRSREHVEERAAGNRRLIVDVAYGQRGQRHLALLRLDRILHHGRPPHRFRSASPTAPSFSIPVRTTPIAREPWLSPTDLKRGSIAGRARFSRGPRPRRIVSSRTIRWWSAAAT